jgi:hypothetical protein
MISTPQAIAVAGAQRVYVGAAAERAALRRRTTCPQFSALVISLSLELSLKEARCRCGGTLSTGSGAKNGVLWTARRPVEIALCSRHEQLSPRNVSGKRAKRRDPGVSGRGIG